jgi:hypothetical protein
VKILKITFGLIVLLILISTLSCSNQNYTSYDGKNRNVIRSQNFSVNTESIGLSTSVKGTVFIKQNPEESDNSYVQIVAWVEKDPKDWGGIGFITRGWKVIDADSSFGNYRDGYLDILLLSESQDISWISVGNYYLGEGSKYADFSHNEGENMKGSVIINMERIKGFEQVDNFELSVKAGSQGEVIKARYWPVKETISIPLNIDSKTP